jgi:hypothetical protein
MAPAPHDVGPHIEYPDDTPFGPQGTPRTVSASSTGTTGTQQASTRLNGQGTLSVDAIVVHGST